MAAVQAYNIHRQLQVYAWKLEWPVIVHFLVLRSLQIRI